MTATRVAREQWEDYALRKEGTGVKVEILGTGCPKCRKTEDMIAEAVRKLGVDAEIVHVTDIDEIIDRGVMMTPAVFVDGEKKVEGRMPAEAEIRKWFGADL